MDLPDRRGGEGLLLDRREDALGPLVVLLLEHGAHLLPRHRRGVGAELGELLLVDLAVLRRQEVDVDEGGHLADLHRGALHLAEDGGHLERGLEVPGLEALLRLLLGANDVRRSGPGVAGGLAADAPCRASPSGRSGSAGSSAPAPPAPGASPRGRLLRSARRTSMAQFWLSPSRSMSRSLPMVSRHFLSWRPSVRLLAIGRVRTLTRMAQGRTTLKVSPRDTFGSRATRRLRKDGLVPGVVYGQGGEARPFQVPVARASQRPAGGTDAARPRGRRLRRRPGRDQGAAASPRPR